MDNWKTHFVWFATVVSVVLLATVTYWLGGTGNEIVSYVSFASALVSIVLAVIAILFAVVYNVNSQQNMGAMRSLITQASYLITQKAEEMGIHSRSMAQAAAYLVQQKPTGQPLTKIPFEFYASYCSHTGLLTIYCLAKSYETGKVMSLLAIAQSLAPQGWNYFNDFIYGMGVLIGFACFLKPGSVDIQLEYQKAKTLPNGLKDHVLADIQRRINDPSTHQNIRDLLNNGLNKIDAYFGSS